MRVGIYWVINDKILYKIEKKRKRKEKQRKYTKITKMIDSSYSHYIEWEKIGVKLFKCEDYDRYPRGRVMYDTKKRLYVIYIDKCIEEKHIQELKEIFRVKKYKLMTDEHYSCQRCINDM